MDFDQKEEAEKFLYVYGNASKKIYKIVSSRTSALRFHAFCNPCLINTVENSENTDIMRPFIDEEYNRLHPSIGLSGGNDEVSKVQNYVVKNSGCNHNDFWMWNRISMAWNYISFQNYADFYEWYNVYEFVQIC